MRLTGTDQPARPTPTTGRTTVHLFSGGCGDVLGFDNAGFLARYAANHMKAAVDTAKANWPRMRVQQTDINNLDMRSVPSADGIVGSPICTDASPASGQAAPKPQAEFEFGDEAEADAEPEQAKEASWARTRMTAWDPIRYADVHRPLFYAGENVPRFATHWDLFNAWLNVWDALGYYPVIASVNAAHISGEGFSTLPQYRNRVVWCMIRKDLKRIPDLRPRPDALCPSCGPVQGVQQWTTKHRVRKVGVYGRQYKYVCPNRRCGHRDVAPVTRGIGEVIDLSVRGHRFGEGRQDRKEFEAYSPATRRRVKIGLDRFGGKPFVITLRNNGTASSLDDPIGTLSAQGGNHHTLVRPGPDLSVDECEVRALTLAEKAAAQGFPPHHILAGTDTQQKLQIGNAVPVNVATWLAQRIGLCLN